MGDVHREGTERGAERGTAHYRLVGPVSLNAAIQRHGIVNATPVGGFQQGWFSTQLA
ncbi:hypothetical protein D3C80_1837120 [compost metagenome]